MYKATIGTRVTAVRERRQNQEIVRAWARIGELERIAAYLLAKMIRKEPVTLQEEPVRRFLRLPEDAADNPDKYMQEALDALEPIGLLQCAACGSEVRDIPGFVDEKCPVCGEHVGSEA